MHTAPLFSETSFSLSLSSLSLCLQRDGHRVLLFSQMTSMLDLLEEYVSFRQWRYQRIDGGTKAMDRQARIDAFNGNGNNASQVRAKGWGEGRRGDVGSRLAVGVGCGG